MDNSVIIDQFILVFILQQIISIRQCGFIVNLICKNRKMIDFQAIKLNK